MAAVLDTAHLASFTGFPAQSIDTLKVNPTVELVNGFLEAISSVAQEQERLKAENLRLTVEHENAVRNSEAKAQSFKSNTEKALQEVELLRQKLDKEEATRADLETKLQTLQTSSSSSSTEVDNLQTRVKQLEKANRDTLSLLESKATSYDKLSQDISSQQQKSQQNIPPTIFTTYVYPATWKCRLQFLYTTAVSAFIQGMTILFEFHLYSLGSVSCCRRTEPLSEAK